MARNIKKVKSASHGFEKALRMGLFLVLLVSIFLALPFQSVFAQTGSITGTVRGPGGTPLADVKVYTSYYHPSFPYATTAADGTYTFTIIPAGSYTVHALGQGYVTQYYNHVDSSNSAAPVTVTSGGTTSGIDFDLVEDPNQTNTSLGTGSLIAAGISYATAIGFRAMVSQSNSLVLGSINGVNAATASVNVGIGTTAPVRQLHVVGDQAVFRMDRPYDTAAFMLVRTDGSGNPLKTFVMGANASASNTGEFVINDLGAAVSGAGTRRMTISNSGGVNFPGTVTALSFTPTSSIAFKTNVKTFENALETVKKLRGVRFDWKDSKKASVGLIAEEVENVVPEVVAHEGKAVMGLNYDSLVGVLVEAVKEQEGLIKQQEAKHQAELNEQKMLIQEQQKIISAHSKEIAELKRLLILSNSVSKAD